MKRIALVAAAVFISAMTFAQVPGTLSYQGILVNSSGAPVADGDHTVTFNFYTQASGGVPVFARGQFTVTTYKGMFTLVLGTGVPDNTINGPLPVLTTDPNYIGGSQYYIELVADNVILTPRVQLSSVPYAIHAQNANTMSAAGLTGTANLPNTVLDTDLQDLADGSLTDTKLGTISTAGKVANSATTATDVNTASAIVARDASGNFSAGTITANLNGNANTVTTNANLTGDVTSVGNATTIASGVIVNADINSAAAIADTKLATISTAGKVANSATTATNANTASAIVARDASGNFSAGTITATLNGNASTATTVTTNANLTGDITSVGNATSIASGVIVNSDISSSAAITDTKLATISTSGKVSGGSITSGTIGGSTSINTSGTITASSYSFSSSKTGYYFVGCAEFEIRNADTGGAWNLHGDQEYGHFSNITGSYKSFATVHLPDGATVDEVRVYYLDDSPSSLTVYFRRTSADGLTRTMMGSVTTTEDEFVAHQATFNPATAIDNQNNRYTLILESDEGTNLLRLYNIRLRYTISQVDH